MPIEIKYCKNNAALNILHSPLKFVVAKNPTPRANEKCYAVVLPDATYVCMAFVQLGLLSLGDTCAALSVLHHPPAKGGRPLQVLSFKTAHS